MPEKLIMIIKLLVRGGNAEMIKSCVIIRNIFCLLGKRVARNVCVASRNVRGQDAILSETKKTRTERVKKTVKANPNNCLAGHDAAARALKGSQGKFPEKLPSAQVGIPHP